MVYFNRFAKRISIASTLMLLSFQASAAYVTTVKSGDSNATAETEFEKVLAEGGTITFEEGAWTINLANSTYKALGDVTIIGQNSTDSSDPDLMGAYEESEFVKTTLTMTGSCMRLTDSCANLTIRDLKWVETGLEVEARHQANVDLDNVFFDITSWSTGEWNKNIFDTNDGIQGTMDHCSFIGFGMRAIKINRSVDQDQYPITQAGKLTVNRCKFRPDPSMYSTKNVVGLNHDSGNDEYAPTMNYGGKEIINTRFIECGISMSKASNMTIANNVFENELCVSEPLHLEEFSHDITIDDNVFVMTGDIERNCITLGAQQTCDDITISNNIVEQTDQLISFISGAGVKDLFVSGNVIMNPVNDEDYINFWGVNNINIQIEDNQPGLTSDHVKIASATEEAPVADGDYYIIWGADQYLGLDNGEVIFTQLSDAPADNKYKWNVTSRKVGYMNNYSTIENLDGSGFLLEVLKGPNSPEQPDFIGLPYTYQDDPIYAKAVGTYADADRQPGFSIFKESGLFCLMAGGNERRSQVIKSGERAQVYVVNDETDADYNWSFVEADYSSVEDSNTEDNSVEDDNDDSTTETVSVAELTPVHDAYVQNSTGYNNDVLRVESDYRTSYLQFDLSSVTGIIESMELEIVVDGDSGNGTITVSEADSDWSESTLSGSNAPVAGAVLTEFSGDLPIGKKLTLDVSNVDLSSSNVTFVLTMESGGNDVSFASKENAALSPVLIINSK